MTKETRTPEQIKMDIEQRRKENEADQAALDSINNAEFLAAIAVVKDKSGSVAGSLSGDNLKRIKEAAKLLVKHAFGDGYQIRKPRVKAKSLIAIDDGNKAKILELLKQDKPEWHTKKSMSDICGGGEFKQNDWKSFKAEYLSDNTKAGKDIAFKLKQDNKKKKTR